MELTTEKARNETDYPIEALESWNEFLAEQELEAEEEWAEWMADKYYV